MLWLLPFGLAVAVFAGLSVYSLAQYGADRISAAWRNAWERLR